MTTDNLPGDHHRSDLAILSALHKIEGEIGKLSTNVETIKAEQTKLSDKVDKIDGNLNGDGSIQDPGIAGTVRGLKGWKDREEGALTATRSDVQALKADVQDFKTWRASQAAIWRQVFAWVNVPMGLIGVVAWVMSAFGGHPPSAPPPLK